MGLPWDFFRTGETVQNLFAKINRDKEKFFIIKSRQRQGGDLCSLSTLFRRGSFRRLFV